MEAATTPRGPQIGDHHEATSPHRPWASELRPKHQICVARSPLVPTTRSGRATTPPCTATPGCPMRPRRVTASPPSTGSTRARRESGRWPEATRSATCTMHASPPHAPPPRRRPHLWHAASTTTLQVPARTVVSWPACHPRWPATVAPATRYLGSNPRSTPSPHQRHGSAGSPHHPPHRVPGATTPVCLRRLTAIAALADTDGCRRHHKEAPPAPFWRRGLPPPRRL